MEEIRGYKCPSCGGAIEFNSAVQKMKCPYCETEYEIGALEDYNEFISDDGQDEMEWDTQTGEEWQEDETQDMQSYRCESCGGEIITEDTSMATSCPFCDNPVLVNKNIITGRKPDMIIPFKWDQNQAKAEWFKFLSKMKLLPDVFKTQSHIEEIKGVYVPYWLFDTTANATAKYKGVRTRHWSDSKYSYTEHKYYAIVRNGEVKYAHVPVDGASKMDDTLMESIEPFRYEEAVPFHKGFLSGFFANKYDVEAKECENRANERMKTTTKNILRNSVSGYHHVAETGFHLSLSQGVTTYAMYPVWILNTRWNNELYTFAMNGQTGKFVGNLPVDKKKATKLFCQVASLTFLATLALLFLVWFILGV